MSSGASEQQPAGTPKSEATRRSILDGAKASFAAKGYSGTTVADITQQSRVTRAGFYYYFRDKREPHPVTLKRLNSLMGFFLWDWENFHEHYRIAS